MLVYPNGSESIASEPVEAWEIVSSTPPTLPTPPQVESYGVDTTGYVCGGDGLIKLRMVPSGNGINVTLRKCDDGPFSQHGEAWLKYGRRQRWGPYSYNAGDSEVSFEVDPVGERYIYDSGLYQAEVSPLGSDATTASGTVTAWPVFE